MSARARRGSSRSDSFFGELTSGLSHGFAAQAAAWRHARIGVQCRAARPPSRRGCPIAATEFTCPACGIPVVPGAAGVGDRVSCPTCGTDLVVPPPPAPPSDGPPIPGRTHRLVPGSRADDKPAWVMPFWLPLTFALLAALTACCCAGSCAR